MLYKVGESYKEVVGHAEGCMFDIDDAGGRLVVFFNRPTPHEVEQFESKNKFELRFVSFSDVIMMLIKVGDLDWMDAPYHPKKSKNLSKLELPQEGTGLSVVIQLFDCSNGMLMHQMFVSLSTDFTRKLFGQVLELWNKEYDASMHEISLNKIFQKYSTRDLVKLSSPGFKI